MQNPPIRRRLRLPVGLLVFALVAAGLVVASPRPAAADGPFSLWAASVVPGTAASTDTSSVTVGVKFRSDVDGFVTGVRFFKGAGNSGTHVGDLWSTSGAHLASATFASESATGWQQVDFASPVAVTAGTIYVASYLAPLGHYAFDSGYFASSGVDNGVLHAPSNAETPNGVFGRGTSSVFPDQTYAAANYWVDVVFSTTLPVDSTPPTVTGTQPAGGAGGVPVNARVSATFSEAVQSASVGFTLAPAGGAPVAASVAYDASSRTATLTPNAVLQSGTSYTATVSGAQDTAGNTMTQPATWSFTTAGSSAPLDQGPGGPILVITDPGNPFSSYYAEMLRNEGFNEFATARLSSVTASTLSKYAAVILGDMSLTSSQAAMLSDWVTAGGNLVAMRPSKELASLLGLTDDGGTLADAYLKVDTASGPGVGITASSMQYHGTADRYTANGASSVATLSSDASTATSNPAVTLRSVGSSGGQAAAFTFDLARSVVEMRQGNPAWAGQDRDGAAPIQPDDLFFGNKAGDPHPDWIDLNKLAIPQADEQQRLLGNLLTQMTVDRTPLPHFWYLPNGKAAAVVLTGDDHARGGTVGRFDDLLAASAPGCSVSNWECVRMSSYIFPGTPITNSQAAAYTAQGFEIGTHVSASGGSDCANFTPASLDAAFTSMIGAVTQQLPGIPPADSERLHCVTWSDWDSVPKTELAHGIRLDTTYYYSPDWWLRDRPGFITGSAMPMRFAATDGSMIDVYQAETQLDDEANQSYPAQVNTLLDNATGPLGYYGVFTVNAHTDWEYSAVSESVIASAKAHGVPLVSGRQMLTWLDARNASSFGSITWDGSTLGFTVSAAAGANGLQALLPAEAGAGHQLTALTRDGAPVPYTLETVKGIQYARFGSSSGAYVATYGGADTSPPVVTGINAAPSATSAVVTWSTSEPATSRVDWGTAPGSLTQNVVDPTPATAHSVTLKGLTPLTAYSFRVTSADGAGNSTTAPDPGASPATFSTADASFTDTTAANFGAGRVDSGAYLAQTGDGEVTLAPNVGAEFSGSTLPSSSWKTTKLVSSGSANVAGGHLTVDGAYVRTSSTFGAGRSLEFVATFVDTPNQSIGLGATLNESPWLMFGTRSGGALWASSRLLSGVQTNTSLGAGFLGAPHRFRIDWTSTSIVYSIDGAVVATHNLAVISSIRPVVRDATGGGPTLDVDWLRLTPYAPTGTFTSRVFDAETAVNWGALTWTSELPSGTTLMMRVRTGNTPTPDGSWSAFATLAASGSSVARQARYLQYGVTLTTSSPATSAALDDLKVRYDP